MYRRITTSTNRVRGGGSYLWEATEKIGRMVVAQQSEAREAEVAAWTENAARARRHRSATSTCSLELYGIQANQEKLISGKLKGTRQEQQNELTSKGYSFIVILHTCLFEDFVPRIDRPLLRLATPSSVRIPTCLVVDLLRKVFSGHVTKISLSHHVLEIFIVFEPTIEKPTSGYISLESTTPTIL